MAPLLYRAALYHVVEPIFLPSPTHPFTLRRTIRCVPAIPATTNTMATIPRNTSRPGNSPQLQTWKHSVQ